MLEFLWWAFIITIGIGIGASVLGFQGALFMALVGVFGGACSQRVPFRLFRDNNSNTGG